MEAIETLLGNIKANRDNPEWLSNACVELSANLYYFNTKIAEAELLEIEASVTLLETPDEGKKMSVAEAEKRAVVLTNNNYGKLKLQGEAVIEAINSIKTRLKVLTWERSNSDLESRL